MITCPNCNHQNPDGAVQCEACYTPLPSKTVCPSCGATIQSDASFCGQCGADLRAVNGPPPAAAPAAAEPPPPLPVPPPPDVLTPDELAPEGLDAIPELVPPEPLVVPDSILPPSPLPVETAEPFSTPQTATPAVSEAPVVSEPQVATPAAPAPGYGPPPAVAPETRLQRNTARLLHIQTDTVLELPVNVSPIRIGKPNDRVPPDIDVSGFPESEIVSRVHANIRVEGDIYYIEDVGSSNGTYVNNMPLPYGNRHRLRPGDRIALGKGDKVSFIFQFA